MFLQLFSEGFKLFSRFKLKAILVSLALCFSSQTLAASPAGLPTPTTKYDKRCYADIPPYVKNENTEDIKNTPVSISADKVQANLQNDINYSGNVEIVHGNKVLKANNTTFNQQTQVMAANGDVSYQDGEITVKSDDSLTTNLETNDTNLSNASYHINGSLVRGYAESADLNGTAKTISLKDATVTTCPKNQESWIISSSEINIDQNEVFGESYNTVFWLHDIPLFYMPYINFPIKNERKSGFLYPSIGYSSSDGFELGVPIYWNIAPNYDMTFAPKFIERRGVLLTNEFRYMPFENTLGKVYGEYFHHDRRIPENDTPKLDERYLININQNSRWNNNDYGLDIDYTHIRTGDFNYINDLDPSVAEVIDNQLAQKATLFVDKDNFDASIKATNYQLLIPAQYLNAVPFKLMPRITANYHDAFNKLLAYNLNFEYSNFEVASEFKDTTFQADRYHFQPGIEVPIVATDGIDLLAKGELLYTYYNQNVHNSLSSTYTNRGFNAQNMDSSTDRFLYVGSVHGKMTFENHLKNMYTLTIEPEVQYMYVPYKNQDNIGLYDTTDRVYDFYSLFSYKKYAGIDRISDTNRISYSLTHRVYDSNYRERLRINIGQAYDFVPQRVKLYPNDTKNYYPRTPVSAAINANIFEWLSAHADMVYNTEYAETTTWNALFNANYGDTKGQLSYRYTRDGNRTLTKTIVDLKQLGGMFTVPITDDVKMIAGMYYDLEQKRNIDQKVALKYESCCYNVGFQIERYNKPDNYTMTAKEETKYGIFFELKGLTSVGINSEFTPATKLLPYNDTVNLNK